MGLDFPGKEGVSGPGSAGWMPSRSSLLEVVANAQIQKRKAVAQFGENSEFFRQRVGGSGEKPVVFRDIDCRLIQPVSRFGSDLPSFAIGGNPKRIRMDIRRELFISHRQIIFSRHKKAVRGDVSHAVLGTVRYLHIAMEHAEAEETPDHDIIP